MPSSVRIDNLSFADIDNAFRLAVSEGWNQTKKDWLRLLQHEPTGCFGAYSHGRLVGTVTTSIYGMEVAWVGMMLVHREHRGLGVGRKLMLAALEYAKTRVSTVKLDATPAGRVLYETLGFVPEVGIERWERGGASPRPDAHMVASEKEIAHDICKIDRTAFGTDRAKMLMLLVQQSCIRPMLVRENGSAAGYAMARSGSRSMYVGPVVSIDTVQTPALVGRLLEQFEALAIYVDFHRGSATGSTILSSRGFVKQRDLTRMYWGERSGAGLSPSIFSIAGPEIG